MRATYALTTIQEALLLATTLRRYLFRGHSRVFNELVPKVHRLLRGQPEPFTAENLHNLESYLLVEFQRMAPAYSNEVPPVDEPGPWMYLMQHHGGATRLLDWSESLFIALYFAVAADPEVDGEVWALHGGALHALSGISGYPIYYNNPVYRWLTMEPLAREPAAYQAKIGLEVVPTRPIAVRPAVNIPRLIVQQGAFPLHPFPAPGTTLPELLTDERTLVRYVIPTAHKEQLRRDLHALGIHRRALFPDLDGLTHSLLEEERTWPTELCSPPPLAGPWPPSGP